MQPRAAKPRGAPPEPRPAGEAPFWRVLFDPMVRLLCARNLRSDRFGTLAAILGVALGTATVNVVVVLDVNTRQVESSGWVSNPDLDVRADTVSLRGIGADGKPTQAKDLKEETHEDYEVMRSAIRLGSLSAFLVGALIVFFTFGVVVERRKREVALLRSLGALPRQVAAIFVREAVLIGAAGAVLGLLAAIPMAYVAARAGITTTGRSRISIFELWFPWKRMALISLVGGAVALLGVLRPARDVLRLDVAQTLRPRFLDSSGPMAAARRTRGVTLVALPFMLLVYILMRPFFQNAVPSLTFFVLEAGLVCVAFLATLVLVPELVRRLGALVVRLIPRGPAAERLLTQRRIEHMGHELAWSVSGVMLVFALLLALHIATHALKREVEVWASSAIENYVFLGPQESGAVRPDITAALPPRVVRVHLSGRTPWPNPVHAVVSSELVQWAEASGRPDLIAMARRLGPGRIILSKMMARRYHVAEGDAIELEGLGGKRLLTIVGVTDDVGYTPVIGPYRNSKTYGVIDAADGPLIAPYAAPLGSFVVLADSESPGVMPDWGALLASMPRARDVRRTTGEAFKADRVRETSRDFVIFDLILALTTVLAAVGIANQMVLSVHARQREIALYRILGMTVSQVRRLILMEGAFIGLLGGALAVLLGVPLGYAAIGALRVVSAFEVDFHLPVTYVAFTIAGAAVVSLLASIHPASRAVSTDSAESVHYE
jgi:putative ABC transport system permease protein